MRYQLDVPIVAHEQLSDFEYEITVHAPQVAREASPGQFMQVLYDQTYNPFTRRPFSVYRVFPDEGTFSIVYLARGIFTYGLRNKQVGQKLSVIGPLGNWFTPDPNPHATHLMIAGGVGAPPLYFFAQRLACGEDADCKVVVVNGARTRDLLVGVEEFDQLGVDVRYTTDDGSHGQQGIVTDALMKILDSPDGPIHVYTCGPTVMMRAVAEICMAREVPCQVSLETLMPCGLGVCMGCVVKIRDSSVGSGYQYLRSCYEGPVFPADRIIWD